MRCRPALGEEDVHPQKIAVAKSCAMIDREMQSGAKNGVKELAKEAGFTESHFCRVFKKVMGMTVGEYRASVSGTKNATGALAASGGKESLVDLQNQNIRVSTSALEFDFNAFSSLDTLDQTQFEFELESGWYDLSRTPELCPPSEMVAEVPYNQMFDDSYSNSNTEVSSIDTTPLVPPICTMDDDLQFLNLDHQFAHVI